MNPAIALSIAGSDPSGGAGIQADLKTFTALGVYGAAALAGLTVQNTQGVLAARPVDPDLVHEQIVAVIDDLPVAATKLGMLSDAAVASRVADLLERRRADFGLVILDPVMVATSGDKLLRDDAIATVHAAPADAQPLSAWRPDPAGGAPARPARPPAPSARDG